MSRISGSCLCGSVRYEADAEPAFVAFCHCRDCQKASGGPYSANVAVPADRLTVEGPLRSYEAKGGSGSAVVRSFCGNCGSSISIECEDSLKGLSLLQAGTLEDAGWVEPSLHIFCSSAQPWDTLPDNAPCLPGAPPSA